ncbi:MAG TPA: type II toxin-antitoxin system RelE/ParE family toxin [Bryobacteraceae bacterium]|jgi:antitoxin ParD1/3/4|nr:type II toxin-antitoxin system RelE/ParE family toxin [Bryobacteraceae bacterium]
MTEAFVSIEAKQDLFAIWEFIARDSVDAADRVETEFYEMFASLARMPEQGYRRTDLSKRPVRFFPLYSYIIVYQPEANPVRIMAVLHGNRNLKRLLKERSL